MPSRKRDEHPRSASGTGQGWRGTRRKHRAAFRYFSQKTVPVQGGYGTPALAEGGVILQSWQELSGRYECRGTNLQSG